jgi:hypothetical protein
LLFSLNLFIDGIIDTEESIENNATIYRRNCKTGRHSEAGVCETLPGK